MAISWKNPVVHRDLRMAATEAASVASQYAQRLPVSRLGRKFFLPVSRVVWIGTQHRMVFAFTDLARHPLDFGLEELTAQLDPSRFFRIHRSTIVNLEHIRKVLALEDGRCKLIMQDKDGSVITVSRYRAAEFRQALARKMSAPHLTLLA